MELSSISLSKADFDHLDWDGVTSTSETRICELYSPLFRSRASEASAEGDPIAERGFSLLAAVTSMYLRREPEDEPFGPFIVLADRRSPIPDDFTDSQLTVLRELAPTITDPELRARIADLIWIRKKDYEMACYAIDSYVESAKALEDELNGQPCEERLRRAISLSASLGRAEHFQKVVSYAEDLLHRLGDRKVSYLQAEIMDILLGYKIGDPQQYAHLALKLASIANAAKNWIIARQYFEIEARWRERAQDVEGKRTALLRSADTYVAESEEALRGNQPSHLVAARHIQSAIEVLRKVPGTQQIRQELHKTLLKYEERSTAEMKAISYEVDIAGFVEKARNAVKGKDVYAAISSLACSGRSPDIDDLRKHVNELMKDHPIQYLVSRFTVNERGKVVARRSSIASTDPGEIESAVQEEIFFQAAHHRELHSKAVVEPMRAQINLEHEVRLSTLMPVVRDNPLVPGGRELIFARALLAGFRGDFLISTHLLIPQLENSMRRLLERAGVTASGLTSEGIQEEYDLNRTLRMPELEKILGQDTTFDLRGLLTERHGTNLRNRAAHGLLEHDEFFSLQDVYLWWLVLRLCYLFIYTKAEAEQDSEKE